MTDPHDPAIDEFLRSLEPRQELVLRFAMRQRFASMRADRKFDARVDELRQQFDDEDRLAMICADANLVAAQIEAMQIEAMQIEAMQKARTRKESGAKWPLSTACKHR